MVFVLIINRKDIRINGLNGYLSRKKNMSRSMRYEFASDQKMQNKEVVMDCRSN